MRAIWKGAINFGLVNIPIALYPAVRKEAVKFRLLRKSDLSPIKYQRIAEADGKEVPWDQIVKGHEYEKGKFVALTEDDFSRVDLEATQTIQITDFVALKEIDPMFFDTPYYLEPQKGGDRAYALLRTVLAQSGKVGIAKVVIKTRQYLAALKPKGDFLVLELMHFADELQEPDTLKAPQINHLEKKELEMSNSLVEAMSDKWEPGKYHDEYHEALTKLIEQKMTEGEKAGVGKVTAPRQPTNVVDLIGVLQQSVENTQRGPKKKAPSAKRRRKAA